jgi:hypothetical protein
MLKFDLLDTVGQARPLGIALDCYTIEDSTVGRQLLDAALECLTGQAIC